MKQTIFRVTLLLSSLLCLFSSYAQTHYIKANSIAGVEVKEGGGSSSICPTYISHLSTASGTDQFFFSPATCLADYLKFEVINPTNTIVKITLTTTYGGAVDTWTLAPNGGRTGVQLIPWSMTYNWKFEQTTATVQMKPDTVRLDAGYGANILAGTNDIVLPVGTAFRVKAGQTLSLGTITQTATNPAELFFVSNNTIGSQTIVLQGYNPTTNVVIGETNLHIQVNAPCSFSILSAIQQSLGSQFYDVKLTSNRTTKPYMYRVFNSAGNSVKQGNTSSATMGNIETIDVGDIPTGIYNIKFYSTFAANCGEPTKQISHVNASDVCSLQASATRSNNNFAISIPTISGVTNYDYTLTNPQDSAIASGVTSGSSLNLNFANKVDGEYYLYLKPNNSTKVCSQRLKLVWLANNSTNYRGYLKRYNNVIDYFEIAGAGDYGGAKDAGTGWVIKETKTALTFRTYVKNLSTVAGAKAILTLREDSSSVSRHVSIAIEKDRIKVLVRTARNANNVVVADIAGKTTPRWIQIRRNGNSAIIEESDSPADSDNPTFTVVKTISDAFAGWKTPYYKGLYVTSGSATNLASAEFHRFLGGPYTGTDAAVDNTPLVAPVLTPSNLTPTANASVTLTITGCKSGYLPILYKNDVSGYSGISTSVTVAYNDVYKARCENGSVVSGFSNTVKFTNPTTTIPTEPSEPTAPIALCGITDKLKLGTKLVGTTSYDIYARIFDGKLWVTQSLNTTPESFLVRAVNFLSITFTKTWTGTDYSCFQGQTSGYGGVVEPTGFTTPTGYTLTQTADGAKIYTLGSTGGTVGGGDEQPSEPVATVFQNKTKLVPIELTNGKYSPQLFPKISTVISNDPVIAKAFPNWAVAWQVEGGNFKANNLKPQDLGISFNYDHNPGFYNGIGERCVDYIYETNPNTGQPWVDDIDTYCGTANKKWTTFISAIPFYERAFSGYGAAGEGPKNQWINNSAEWAYDTGIESAQARRLGHGDKVNGKVNVGLINADIEIGLEMGHDYLPRHLAFLMGGGAATQGYFFSQYSAAINGVGAELSTYPDDQGNYPTVRKNIDGTTIYEQNGVASVNNIPTSWDWNPSNKISLTGRVSTKGIGDYPNVLPCIEISSTSDMTFKHGQTYARKGGWKYSYETWQSTEVSNSPVAGTSPQQYYHSAWMLSYSPSNDIGNTIVDKFGMDRNTNHIIADVINYGDVNKDYSIRKLNNRKVILQSKITCDRAHEGVFLDAQFTNQALKFLHYDREYSFDIGGFTALTGCEWQIWDRNYDKNLDGYHGAFGLVNLMHQRVNGKSFVDLKPTLNFLLWNSEVSYNGGTSYVKNKATDYILSENNLPQRQAISSDGYWVIFAARPEGIEPTSAKFRVVYNGTTYYHTITANDWETVDYTYKDVALANLPLAAKDYYFTIIKLGSSSSTPVDGGTSVTAPTIISNPVSPIAGNSVTFTASGCSAGTVKWYNGTTQAGTGTTYSISSAVAGNVFKATCTEGSVVSSASNTITIATNEVVVFLFWGESNAGTRNEFSTASAGDLGVRTGVRILNNSNNTLETLNIASTTNGGNSSYGENDCDPNENWGWEVPAANYFASGALQKPELIIVKVAQGGSLIGQWNTDIQGGYFQTAQARINAVKAQLANEGKVPIWKIYYSQGINNGRPDYRGLTDPGHFPNLSGIDYWGAATTAQLNEIGLLTSTNAKIVMTKFGSTQYGDYLNAKIDQICNNSNGKYVAISPTGLTVQPDLLHWDAVSTKTAFNRMLEAHFGVPTSPPTGSNGITITQPTRANNYYTTSTNNTGIIYDYVLDMNDNVYLENAYMKVGISLRGGGAITYFAKPNGLNFVNNDDDGGIGRQIQPDYYQKPSNFSIPGKTLSPHFPRNGYNTTLGGDDFKNVPTLLEHYPTSDGYFLKLKPLIWGIDGHVSEITMSVLYKLEGNTLKATYTYESDRTDSSRPPADSIAAFSVPSFHLNKFFNKIYTYGKRGGVNEASSVVTADIPRNLKDTPNTILGYDVHEGWVALESTSQNIMLGVINKKTQATAARVVNIVNENLGGTEEDATAIMEMLQTLNVDFRQKQTIVDNVYFMLAPVSEIRAKAQSLSN